MTGQELFEKYTNKRDYSGSDEDQYAKLLMTIRSNIFDKIYSLLEKAEADGKRLHIETRRLGHPLLNDELTIEDIILV